MQSANPWIVLCCVLLGVPRAGLAETTSRPVLVWNRLVDPDTGGILGEVPGVDRYCPAEPVPGSPGHFRVGEAVVDVEHPDRAERPVLPVTVEGATVRRAAAEGQTGWSATLPSPAGGRRPPDRLVHEDLVIVSHAEGLTALDLGTGKEVWRSPGPADRLLVAGALVLAASCGSLPAPDAERLLVARDLRTGEERYACVLPPEHFPDPLLQVAGLTLVRGGGTMSDPGYGILLERTGRVHHRLDEYVTDVQQHGDGLVVATPTRILSLDPGGEEIWSRTRSLDDHLRSVGAVCLPGGDIIVHASCPIADSGVTVERLGGADGAVRWQATCESLQVGHSKYRHRVYVELRDDLLVIVSQGSYGSFVELLDPASGHQIDRFRLPR